MGPGWAEGEGLGDGSGMGAGGSACRGRLEKGRRDCEGGAAVSWVRIWLWPSGLEGMVALLVPQVLVVMD